MAEHFKDPFIAEIEVDTDVSSISREIFNETCEDSI